MLIKDTKASQYILEINNFYNTDWNAAYFFLVYENLGIIIAAQWVPVESLRKSSC